MTDSRFNKFCSAYKLLEVEVGSSFNEIKSSYRRLAKKIHPDKNRGKHEKSAHERFTILRDSYVLLCDDVERRRFEEAYLSARNSSQTRQNNELRTKDRNSLSGKHLKAENLLKKGNTNQTNLESLHRESIHLINIFKDRSKTRVSEGEYADISEKSLRNKLKNVHLDKIVDKFNEFENMVLFKLTQITQGNNKNSQNTSSL